MLHYLKETYFNVTTIKIKVFVDGAFIGGGDDVVQLQRDGKLDNMIQSAVDKFDSQLKN